MVSDNLTLQEMSEAVKMFENDGMEAFYSVAKRYGLAIAQLLAIVNLRKIRFKPGTLPTNHFMDDEVIRSVAGMNNQKGQATQITLSGGKFLYEKPSSPIVAVAMRLDLACQDVSFTGHCNYDSINKLAHEGVTIHINGRDVSTFIDKIATEKECAAFYDKIRHL